jgi:hypothetical protein
MNGVIIHPVFFVPEADFVLPFLVCHGIGDKNEMLGFEACSKIQRQEWKNLTSKNLDAISSYTGLCLANSRAIFNLPVLQ